MADQSSQPSTHRVRVFVDFWNIQLALNDSERSNFLIDWAVFPRWLATEGVRIALADPTVQPQFEGVHVYVSYNPRSPQDLRLKKWATTVLDRMPGVQVVIKERVPRFAPRCPSCHDLIEHCPHCQARLAGTVEKGVDTAIATDLIRLAWENGYDWAILVSSDADFIPVAEFLQAKGRKVIHGAFPPAGSNLSYKCWASVDIGKNREAFRRASPPSTSSS